MTYRHFYDISGDPLTGKPPAQIRVRGGTLTDAVVAGVNGVMNSFLAEARISLAKDLSRTVTLASGVRVTVVSRFGTVFADVEIPPAYEPTDEIPEFFGGILARPIYYSDESVLFGPAYPDFDDPGLPLPEATSRGVAPGRPAVPGVENSDTTEWLVIQIARNKPLDDEPVRKGAVKIFRIKDPLFGGRVEFNSTPGRYLLSATDSFDEFYICGVRAEYLPSLPIEFSATETRIRTFGFEPASFEKAAKTSGIVVVAADRELYAINTRNRPPGGMPTWQLLSVGTFDAPIQYLNSFGEEFTEEVSPTGVVTITCSGSNGAGVCSGFRVTISPVSGGPPVLAGEIFPMHDGSTAAVPNVHTYSASLNVSGTIFSGSTPAVWTGGTSPGSYTTEHRGSTIIYSVSRTKSAGETEQRYDRIFGGAVPRYSSGASTNTVDLESSWTFDDWILGDVTLFEAPDKYIQNFAAGFAVLESLTMVSSQEGSTSDQRTTTTEYTRDSYRLEGPTDLDFVPPGTGTAYTRTTAGATTSLPPDPVEEWKLTGADIFRKIIWRRRAARAATRTPYGVESGSPTLASDPLSPFRDYVDSEVEEVTAYTAIELTSQLKRQTGETLQEWPDAFARFDATPAWAGPQTFTVPGGEKYAMITYRTGPDWTLPVSGVASYFEWFPAIHLPLYALSLNGILIAGGLMSPTGAGPTSFSYSYSYDGSEPVVYLFSDFIAAQPQTVYAYGTVPATTTIQVQVPSGPGVGADADTGGVAGHLLNNFTTVDGAGYDIRTGGFIAQSIWTHEHTDDTYATSLEAFIGNDVSVVPLRAVLDEWRALGGADPATDDKSIVLRIDGYGALL